LLGQLVGEFVSRAGAAGFTLKQLMKALKDLQPEEDRGEASGLRGEGGDCGNQMAIQWRWHYRVCNLHRSERPARVTHNIAS
jgi:hypothetical protein